MGRYTGPKNRIARRFGANIFGRARNPLIHKMNPPGVHGARRRKKSDFGVQLEEQQKLKAVYGMLSQKQLLRYYRKAVQKHGNTSELLLSQLETRLDNIVYRLKFGSTIFAAQQLVSHGHILVNGKKVDRRSFVVKPGMVVSLKEKSQKNAAVQNAVASANREIPPYLELDGQFAGKLVGVPEIDQVVLPIPVNVANICDFLAHTH